MWEGEQDFHIIVPGVGCSPFLLLFVSWFFSGVYIEVLFIYCFAFVYFVCVYMCECSCITVVMGRLEENSWDSTCMLVLKVKDRLSNLVASGLTCRAVLPSPTIYLGFEIRCRYRSQAGIELVVPLLWSPNCCDYRCALPCPAFLIFFLKPLV